MSRERRGVVVLGHPGHAGMLRAARVLDEAAAAHGWALEFVLAEGRALADHVGLPRERTRYLPALAGSRHWTQRLLRRVAAGRLARLVAGADLLYACTLSSFPLCWAGARRLRIPVVVHVYSSYDHPSAYRKHGLAHARHVVAPSGDSLALAGAAVGGFGAGVRAHVVYNGVDVARIARQAAEAPPAGLPAGRRARIGMVGNLDARKNPALLVEAAVDVRRMLGDVAVLLVGAFQDAAYERQVRRRIAALGLTDAVTVTGFLPNPFPVVRSLDVVVHPARRDPFPLALLEAMALERPIVATAVGGVPEMIQDAESGLLVPADDAHALARAVIGLLRDPGARERLGARARARLLARFSLEGFARAMFGVFDEAVRDGSG